MLINYLLFFFYILSLKCKLLTYCVNVGYGTHDTNWHIGSRLISQYGEYDYET